MKLIRVLIADDSSLSRALLRQFLERDPSIQVIAEAVDGEQVIQMAQQMRPDIITMDIEMPKINGIKAIETIMTSRAIPILVVSSIADAQNAYNALLAGALDVIQKPDYDNEHVQELIAKVKLLSGVSVFTRSKPKNFDLPYTVDSSQVGRRLNKQRIVVIASSTGGPQALAEILPHIDRHYPFPIIIAQHIAEGFTQGMVDWLNRLCRLPILLAKTDTALLAGHVYVCPAESNVRILPSGKLQLEAASAREIHHPNCDLLLSSAAENFGSKTIGLILTGMGKDGAKGMAAIHAKHGTTLAQDESSSIIYGMNRVAIEAGSIQHIVPLDQIAHKLNVLGGVA